MLKVRLQRAPAHIEQFLLHLLTRLSGTQCMCFHMSYIRYVKARLQVPLTLSFVCERHI